MEVGDHIRGDGVVADDGDGDPDGDVAIGGEEDDADGWVADAFGEFDGIADVVGDVDDGIVSAENGVTEADCDACGVADDGIDVACDVFVGASLTVVVVGIFPRFDAGCESAVWFSGALPYHPSTHRL